MQTSRKEKFHKQLVAILLKNDCSVRQLFYTIFIPLKTRLQYSVLSIDIFQGKLTFTWKTF